MSADFFFCHLKLLLIIIAAIMDQRTFWHKSVTKRFDLIFLVFNTIFSYIMATSFSGGRSRSTRREPPTMGKQLVNFIICGCESSAPFLVIDLYELLGNPTKFLTHWATRAPLQKESLTRGSMGRACVSGLSLCRSPFILLWGNLIQNLP